MVTSFIACLDVRICDEKILMYISVMRKSQSPKGLKFSDYLVFACLGAECGLFRKRSSLVSGSRP